MSTTDQTPIPVTPVRHEQSPLMLFMAAASGGAGDVSFELDTTLGMGGMMFRLTVQQEGKERVVETIDFADVVQAWVNQIVATS